MHVESARGEMDRMRANHDKMIKRVRMKKQRPRKVTATDERPADIKFWYRDGFLVPYRARIAADTVVSIGRTDSKRALGFIVSRGKLHLDFVLNLDQVRALAAYLELMADGLRKPLGRKPMQLEPTAFTVRRKKNN